MSTEFQDAHLAEVKPLVEKEEVIILKLFRAYVFSVRTAFGTVHVFLDYFEHILWKKKRKTGDGIRVVH